MPTTTTARSRSLILSALAATVLLSPFLLESSILMRWDLQAFLAINAVYRHSVLDPLLWCITQLGSVEFVVILDVFLFVLGRRRWATYLLLLLIAYSVVGYGMKFVIDRPRPYVTYPEIQHMVAVFEGSFPSGHALGASGLAALLYARRNRLLPVALLLAAMVLFTRVFLGLHYPSDVLVGAMIGMLIGLLVGGLDLEVQDTAPIWRRSDPSIK